MVHERDPVNISGGHLTTLGERLKEERERLGISQTDFGALGRVGKSSQINYEKGDRSPDGNYFSAIAVAGVDILYIITGRRAVLTATDLRPDETQMLTNYRALASDDRATVQRVTTALAESSGLYRNKPDSD